MLSSSFDFIRHARTSLFTSVRCMLARCSERFVVRRLSAPWLCPADVFLAHQFELGAYDVMSRVRGGAALPCINSYFRVLKLGCDRFPATLHYRHYFERRVSGRD